MPRESEGRNDAAGCLRAVNAVLTTTHDRSEWGRFFGWTAKSKLLAEADLPIATPMATSLHRRMLIYCV